jgi:hypothetical protein
MDESTFNLEVRKFLKTFGVNAQREIEKAVRARILADRALLTRRGRREPGDRDDGSPILG